MKNTYTIRQPNELDSVANEVLDQVLGIDDVGKVVRTPRIGFEGTPGPQGPQGERGPEGPEGPKGPKGDKGDQGEPGEKGDEGPEGPEGEKGDPGPQGEKGDIGPKGDKGDPGDMGPPGEKGDKGEPGEKGDIGPEGPQGPPGEKGDQGPEGPQGERGPKGDTGDPGKSAYQIAVDHGYQGTEEDWLTLHQIEMWNATGLKGAGGKVFHHLAEVKDGKWEVDYAHVGFTTVMSIQATAHTDGYNDNAGSGNYAVISIYDNQSARGISNSATSAGLLAAMVSTKSSDGVKVSVTVMGV